MRTETRQIIAREDEQGLRLDVFLQSRYRDFSRNEWQNRIGEGDIRINGSVARSSRRLNAGDVIDFSYTMPDEPVTPTEIPVLYEDGHFLVINKPAGLPVHPSGIYQTGTVTTILTERKILSRGHLVHRLDRETSGVLVLAKSRDAATKFQKVLRSGEIDKDYLTIIEGQITERIDAKGFIFQLPGASLKRRRYFTRENPPAHAIEPQTCRTVFTPIEKRSDITLVEARIFTGRMHQIRATLSSLGYPVVGDKLYGVDENLYFKFADDQLTNADWSVLRMSRCALHAARLVLPHPVTGQPWELIAPLPTDMGNLLQSFSPG